MPATTPDTHDAIDAVWRIESARLIAGLTRITGDLGLAEDLAQDALVVALERWPRSGIPDNPGAWLMATAEHRAIDQLRRGKMLDRKHEQLGHELEAGRDAGPAELDAAIDDPIGDDLLRLMFIACHPVLSTEARVALTLRLLGGLTTDEIARAFLVPESTVAQRIVRAKRTLREARVPFEVPRGAELTARLASVLEVIYLVFNEGYSATAGDEWVRPALCDDALRLGRILAELVPAGPEVQGLVGLGEIQASRLGARVGPGGEPILLADQDRSRWDQLLVRRGLAALEQAEHLAGALGPYALQAAIAGCHARARTADETDWTRITALYDALAQLTQSPVVEVNRAVAYTMAFGPAAGLEIADALQSEPALASYHLLPTVRGDFLFKLGRFDEARAEVQRAAGLTRNPPARSRPRRHGRGGMADDRSRGRRRARIRGADRRAGRPRTAGLHLDPRQGSGAMRQRRSRRPGRSQEPEGPRCGRGAREVRRRARVDSRLPRSRGRLRRRISGHRGDRSGHGRPTAEPIRPHRAFSRDGAGGGGRPRTGVAVQEPGDAPHRRAPVPRCKRARVARAHRRVRSLCAAARRRAAAPTDHCSPEESP